MAILNGKNNLDASPPGNPMKTANLSKETGVQGVHATDRLHIGYRHISGARYPNARSTTPATPSATSSSNGRAAT